MSQISLHSELENKKKELKKESLVEKETSPTLLLAETNEVRETEALRTMGLIPEIEEHVEDRGKEIIRNRLEQKYETLYSGEEIKELCMKYGLRFLPTKHFKGPLKEDLGEKILEFNESENKNSTLSSFEAQNYFILAPREAFSRKRSSLKTDPILFYKVDDGDRGTTSRDDHKKEKYYTIVYEWGNKFNIWRMITSYKHKNVTSNLTHFFLLLFATSMIASGFLGVTSLASAMISSCVTALLGSIIKLAALSGEGNNHGSSLTTISWNKHKD